MILVGDGDVTALLDRSKLQVLTRLALASRHLDLAIYVYSRVHHTVGIALVFHKVTLGVRISLLPWYNSAISLLIFWVFRNIFIIPARILQNRQLLAASPATLKAAGMLLIDRIILFLFSLRNVRVISHELGLLRRNSSACVACRHDGGELLGLTPFIGVVQADHSLGLLTRGVEALEVVLVHHGWSRTLTSFVKGLLLTL